MITKTHNYYFLPSRRWPVLCRLRSFNLLFSFCVFLKFLDPLCFVGSLLSISFSCFVWWVRYVKEFSLLGMDTSVLEQGVKIAMILFISSEVFFFFSFFWSYFHFFLNPGLENGFCWPPEGVLSFDVLNVPFLNTLILLRSGAAVTMSHFFFWEGKTKLYLRFLFITVSLGFLFTFFQVKEYRSSFFRVRDGNFGTSFFILTGFHGIHVIVGSIFLATTIFNFFSIASSLSRNLRFEIAAWYWHFVDVVWLFLFYFLYYLNN